ncbi:PREDICTED: N(4)-(Beta-N-acetylglucosaminyl)-L-asparaginase-like [Ceratosolen solmsi marchali]|uniref:N(4)-(beta-N-acetylglucosaminyl)-L-asparaginase n=1 Tax=Ceratosolen solmsi marchali TaxID=326594 RepID=A0AAJ6YNH2_9HYME|nr:PREDICTED: N(4)-(Beta-N-acetylglucosaminyl)-L-asparaginase-like [Ceratosolen solmsi marchali]
MDIFQLLKIFSIIKIILFNFLIRYGKSEINPVVIVTWDYPNATQKAWKTLYAEKRSALDAIEESCTLCEQMQCRGTVGFGGNPDENGETTLDALIMDGVTMDVGAVGGLRNIKDAISVARKVMENTKHSLIGGELAADFASQIGFKKETLQTQKSRDIWQKWKNNNCQPNFWENVSPNPSLSCGPYKSSNQASSKVKRDTSLVDENNHDTIGVVALDVQGRIAAGVSTNGQKYKIPGRIGDSAVTGAGAYADGEVGAAAATGDGDIIMRFLPSYLSVELMRLGVAPTAATETAVRRMVKYYPKFRGAVIALNKAGEYGAACHGLDSFPHYIANVNTGEAKEFKVPCLLTKKD